MAPETEARNALIAVINAEFTVEGYHARDDKIHESLGSDGTKIGVYVDNTVASQRNRQVSEIEVVVQFFAKYNKEIDPKQAVSPAKIESYAERFRSALKRRRADPNTATVWYFTLERIAYPDDPTGNKSRFVAYLRAHGNNSALVETTA